MRVAAIYDIHGNLPALEEVLHDVRQSEVDLVVVGGDVVPGPMPRESLAVLIDFDMPMRFIQGNCEAAVLEQIAGAEPGAVPEQAREAMRWTAEQIHPDYAALVAGWPKSVRLEVDGLGDVLFCHATPRSDTEVFTRLTSDERLLPAFEEVGARVVVCGHTHMQFDRAIGDLRVVNAGSVGMPFGETGAYWVVLGPGVQLRRTRYDLEEAARRIRRTKYPQAEDFAANNVLQPPV